MIKSIGKIIAVDAIKKIIYVCVDKSQTSEVSGQFYYVVLFQNPLAVNAISLALKESSGDKKLYFGIDASSDQDLFVCLSNKIGNNVSFSPNNTFPSTIGQNDNVNISFLAELIIS